MTTFNQIDCAARVKKLSPQMLVVLRSMAQGNATKQIAAELKLSEGTVRVYREQIFSRLGVNNAMLAVRVATKADVV